MTEELTPRQEAYRDVFHTAIEQGIGYWAEVEQYKHVDLERDYFAVIHDREDEDAQQYEVNEVTIVKGIKMLGKHMRDNGNFGDSYQRKAVQDLNLKPWDADFDAITADMIVQFALFGEVTYG